ncbi:hypothetical protein GC425_09390 [Corynebacterium sp. zg254]|uniref:Integral membrane protein n=1 Tax=Corynebacterium zhongnanshanii TaxID=2768834 RepID=A0ABQ6VBS9_9CORY|nr:MULTISPECIES: hypothetical protein [Corynebacterium]KAB3519201.1 hypothetical protein F8377_09420 [Corynebacterium zhongnanshanii]MCR5915053.1 hypothetical protein [Corynebacterium sp. zg254]
MSTDPESSDPSAHRPQSQSRASQPQSPPVPSPYEIGLDENFPQQHGRGRGGRGGRDGSEHSGNAGNTAAGSRGSGSSTRPAGLTAAEQEQRNQRSTRQAFIYFFTVPIVVFALAGIVLVVSRATGGPLCEAGDAQWLCSRGAQIWFSLLPGLVAMGSVFLAGYITYYKWRTQQRWRWWIAVVWLSMPFALAWITGTGSLLLLGH